MLIKDRSNLLLLIFFSILVLVGVLSHEMWRDEAEAWLLARDSSSVIDLFYNKRFSGHPSLWYISLFALNKFSHNILLMQLFHYALAVLGIYLVVRFAPFSKLQKTLFCFSYFPFYEYAIISRNYEYGILFLFLFCVFFTIEKRNYLLLFLILTFMTNANTFSWIMAVCLAVTLLFEMIIDHNKLKIVLENKINVFLGIIIFCLGALASFKDMLLPSYIPMSFVDSFNTRIVCETLLKVFYSYVPVPNIFTNNFWGTTVLVLFPFSYSFGVCIALFFWIYSLLIFLKKPISLFLYFIGSSSMVLFLYLKGDFSWHMRHYGHIFILFIICLWISEYSIESKKGLFCLDKISKLPVKYKSYFIICILFMQCFAGMFAFIKDLRFPFSQGKSAAMFIKNKNLDDLLIVAYPDYIGSVISAYLDKLIYYPQSHKFGSYITWYYKRQKKMSLDEVFLDVEKIISSNNKDLLLILNRRLSISQLEMYKNKLYLSTNKDIRIVLVKKFENSIIADEVYFLYTIKPRSKY